ncbi:MAG: rhodanese-like domain-containing protein [Elusimicrobia bacterium]|nr:rhodanese-like domain-containing protein [Elusimicrobiota bacterium]
MKILLAVALFVFAAAGAYALDLAPFFGGRAAKAALPADPGQAVSAYPLNVRPQDVAAFTAAMRPVVIDIRRPEEYAAGHLSAASLQLDYYAPDFKDQLAKLDKTVPYLIYCRSGHRSGLALAMMQELGFTQAHDIAGGITAWTAAGLPVVK